MEKPTPSPPPAAPAEPRVMFLLQRFPPAFGGGVQFLAQVRDFILKQGFACPVITGNRGIPGGDQPGVHRLPSPGGERLPRLDAYSFALMAGPVLLAHAREFDLIHTMGNGHYVYEAILLGQLLGKPVIVSSIQNRSDDPGGIVKQRFGRLKNSLFSRASGYICCSGLQLEEYRRAGYPREKVHFIPNGVDLTRFRPCRNPEEKERLRARLGLVPREFTVVTVGAVCERKGTDLLIDSWIRYKDGSHPGRLVVVGPITPDDPGAGVDQVFLKSVQDRLASAGVADSVIFTGRVGNVEDHLRAADVFALMSRGEGFPYALLEAMDCRLPFLIWDLPDYSGYDLRDGEQGFLIPPFDVERLAARLADLHGAPARVEALGRSALRLGSRFDLESALRRHATLYRDVAARTPHPRGNPGDRTA